MKPVKEQLAQIALAAIIIAIGYGLAYVFYWSTLGTILVCAFVFFVVDVGIPALFPNKP